MDDLYRILEIIASSEKSTMVLATIIKVEGSAYKKEGSSMLIMEDGLRIGTLTAGCLEVDLNERAKQVWAAGQSCTVEYDLNDEDDLSWGQGAGCNGVITVLLEPVKEELRRNLISLKKRLDARKTVTRIKRFTKKLEPKEDVYVVEDGTKFGSCDFFNIEYFDVPVKGGNPYKSEKGMKLKEHTSDLFFINQMVPKPYLYVFGAGEDARPLASLAARTGFNVSMIDWRPALCHNRNFPEAKELFVGPTEEMMKKLIFTKKDFVVIMTHQFQKDRYILSQLQDKTLFYLGVLGPKKRTERLLRNARVPDHIYSPAGLSIGAIGPEEIAVSIVGEMIGKIRSNRKTNL
ncbi:XdhC family protein [Mesobacillus zeae]|uniref:XdhC family protein n=1 Tax=Mesobacillus zeae TaxID=1917180 RepID=A0A398BDT8_9BACI|nr:XdhC family protein [Mesobacillus zeae]RID85766.1 XdhC family protein [Mesobacillus zeae]